MKARIIYIILAALILTTACEKTEAESPKVSEISIHADIAATKSLLESFSEGDKIMVYDIFTDITSDPIYYIENNITKTGTDWQFDNSNTYYWTLTGEHKFFGWLSENGTKTSENFFGNNFNFSKDSRKLTVPSKALYGEADAQYDFLYSDVDIRKMNASEEDPPVALKLNHLFTAFSIGAVNNMESEITINEFKVLRLYNESSAEIDFSTEETSVSYGQNTQSYSDDSQIFKQHECGYTIGKKSSEENTVANIFNGASTKEYTMVWPQAASQVHSSEEPVENEGMITYPDDWKMYIKYTSDGATVERYVNFPDMAWEAGKKYHFDLKFADKYIDVGFEVADWGHQSQVVDYEADAVLVKDSYRLFWRDDTCQKDPGKGYAYVQSGMPVRGLFGFEAPLGGTWMATLTGDIDAFTITPESGIIDGKETTIAVTPKPEAMGLNKDLKVQVKFAVRRTDGRTIAADEMIQPTNAVGYVKYTIVLPAN